MPIQHDPSTRSHLAAAAVLAAVMLLVFWPLTANPGDLLVGVQRDGRNDVTAHSLAARDLLRQTLFREGGLPGWLESGLLGSPWWGNPQSAMFYPPHWLFILIPAATAISWLTVAHHWWAGLGVYFYCRRLQCSWSASLLGATCFGAAPFLIAQTGEGHSTQVFLIAWAPWAALTYDSLRRGARGAAPLMAALLAIAFFCGHVQEVYYLVVLLSGFVAVDCLTPPRPGELKPLRLLGTWFIVGVATAALVAIELAPNWIYTKFGVRAQGMTSEVAGRISASPESFWQLIDPFALGGPGDYSGPGDFYWETLCCFGLAPLIFAIIGATQWKRKLALRWVVVAIVTLLFAMGDDTPLFPLMHSYVPGMSLFRAPGRALFFSSLAIAVLAAHGWDTVRAVLRIRPSESRTARADVVFSLVAMFVCAGELAWYSNQMCTTVASSSIRRQSLITDAILEETHRGRVLAPQELLSDREAFALGIDKLRRYEPVPLARTLALFGELTESDAAKEITGFGSLEIGKYDKSLLDMLNVTHLVVASADPQDLEGWELIRKGRVDEELVLRGRDPRKIPFAIYRNRTALPRAYVVGSAIASTSPSRLATLDPRAEVLLAEDVIATKDERQSFVAAEIVRRRSNQIVVRTNLEHPGYLVISESHYPGWRIESGEPLLAANVAVRATPLTAGEHELTINYTPPGRLFGLLISTIAWVAATASLLSNRRKRRIQTGDESIESNGDSESV